MTNTENPTTATLTTVAIGSEYAGYYADAIWSDGTRTRIATGLSKAAATAEARAFKAAR